MYFESVRPELIYQALTYLKENYTLYSDTSINLGNMPNNLLSLSDDDSDQESENIDTQEEVENLLHLHRFNFQETLFILNVLFSEEVNIAPGEGRQPTSMLNDEFCEELAFPYLFPWGKFGYKVERYIKLSPSKYFNEGVLNFRQLFASDPDFIFFAQQLKLKSQINVAMKKVFSGNLTGGLLSQNFSERVKSFTVKDEAYHFMSTIKGTPAYWKKLLYEVLAMVKQLGLPTFFITLSCADLHWNELISIIVTLNKEKITEDDINNMNSFERCKYLNLNPVLLARHFQYRVEVFFKVIVVDAPLGNVKYHAIRVEFQVR